MGSVESYLSDFLGKVLATDELDEFEEKICRWWEYHVQSYGDETNPSNLR